MQEGYLPFMKNESRPDKRSKDTASAKCGCDEYLFHDRGNQCAEGWYDGATDDEGQKRSTSNIIMYYIISS